MTINFENRTDFFNTDYEDDHENAARKKLCDTVCTAIKHYIEEGHADARNTVLQVSKIHDYFKHNYNHIDGFMDLWRDEDYADIVYANEVHTDHGKAFIVAFVGKEFDNLLVTVYEF